MVLIIGGGISGLSLAYYLKKQGLHYTLVEAGNTTGGVIATQIDNGHLMENGPTSLLADPLTMEIIKDLNLEEEVIPALSSADIKYIYRNKSFHKIPSGPLSLLSSRLLSWSSKISIIKEYSKASEIKGNETINDFVTRRFSKEISDYLAAPVVNSIYAGSHNELIIDHLLPQLKTMEKNYGSVLKGFLKNKKGSTASINFKKGIQQLTNQLSQYCGENIVFKKAVNIRPDSNEYITEFSDGSVIRSKKVVLCCPAYEAAALLKENYQEESIAFSHIKYPPLIKAYFTGKGITEGHHTNGYGVLFPNKENHFINAVQFHHNIYNNNETPLLSAYIGGSSNAKLTDMCESSILKIVKGDLKRYFGIKGELIPVKMIYLKNSLPQYDQSYQYLAEAVERLKKFNLHICSNWYGGISLKDCLKKSHALSFQI